MTRWALHPKILEKELFSSWIKRLAQEYFHDVQTILGHKMRKISHDSYDNNPPEELISRLSKHTGTDQKTILSHTFQFFEEHYPEVKNKKGKIRNGLESANRFNDRFVLSIRDRPKDNGTRYCPKCLDEDEIPYFRIHWRLGFYTACHIHDRLMNNTCQQCGYPVYYFNSSTDIEKCRNCKKEWKEADQIAIDSSITNHLLKIFYDRKSIYGLSSSQFLGYFWKTFTLLFSRKDDYLERFCKKLDLWDEAISHPLYLRHQGMKLVWELFSNELVTFERPIPCIECDETFPDNRGLSKHLIYHKKPKLECQICTEKFHMNFEFKRHKKVHKNPTTHCLFCKAPFNRKQRVTSHIHKIHSDELKKRIKDEIIKFENANRTVSYVSIAKGISISRSLFNLYNDYSNIFKEHNDLRYYFHKYANADISMEERMKEYKKLVNIAIERLLSRKKDIAQTTVAKEMGVDRKIFHDYPELSEPIEENRTIGELKVEDILEEVENAIDELLEEDIEITFTSITDKTGRPYATLNKDDKIRNLILKYRSSYLPNQEVQLQEVKKVINKIKSQNEILTKTAIMEQMEVSWNKLFETNEIAQYIDSEIEKQKQLVEEKILETLDQIIEEMIKSDTQISFRGVARELDVEVHKILGNSSYKEKVQKGIDRQEQGKVKLVKDTLKGLIEENERITFIEIHRRTGLNRKFIEETEIRKLVIRKMYEQKIKFVKNAIKVLKDQGKNISFNKIHRMTGLSREYIEITSKKIRNIINSELLKQKMVSD